MHPEEVTRKVMRANRSTNTRPEQMMRYALLGSGIRESCLLQHEWVSGHRPDFALVGKGGRVRVCVFVDGCYWHQCPIHGTVPKSNVGFWLKKFQANAARDRRNNRALLADGIIVYRIWECTVRRRAYEAAELVKRAFTDKRRRPQVIRLRPDGIKRG